MTSVRCVFLCLVLALVAVPHLAAQTTDADGCKDSPLIARFPGTTIYECEDKADDVYTFHGIGSKQEDMQLEGEYHYVMYSIPDSASQAQVTRNLVTAFRNAGYTFVQNDDQGQFTVHMGKTWIEEDVTNGGNYKQHILIETQVTQDVVATAADLSSGIASSGHTVVNGIFFDTGKADLTPESAAALKEVVAMLQQDPNLKVYVVGHTDNVGALAANLELSRQRAAAVVQVLITQYGIAAGRLSPYGDGPYAPVTSNDTEGGRAMNRRVELVKQ